MICNLMHRYSRGGSFAPHQDKYHLTVNVLLDEDVLAKGADGDIDCAEKGISNNLSGDHSGAYNVIRSLLSSARQFVPSGGNASRFEGGGTIFWQQTRDQKRGQEQLSDEVSSATSALDTQGQCSVLLQPKQGMGVLFNGSCFRVDLNVLEPLIVFVIQGEIVHAGREVTSGVRHLFVCSFSLAASHNKVRKYP